jgi:hypothetical protein
MKILSIRQSWASLIVSGNKDVENRTWPTRYRGPVLIHASQQPDDISHEDIERRFGVSSPAAQPRGGVVGIADIVDCVSAHGSKWYAGTYVDKRTGDVRNYHSFALSNARPLPFVRWKGALSLRAAPRELIEELGLEALHIA